MERMDRRRRTDRYRVAISIVSRAAGPLCGSAHFSQSRQDGDDRSARVYSFEMVASSAAQSNVPLAERRVALQTERCGHQRSLPFKTLKLLWPRTEKISGVVKGPAICSRLSVSPPPRRY